MNCRTLLKPSEVVASLYLCQKSEPSKRLAELGIAEEGDVTHITRLRVTIVAAIPDLECVQNPQSRSWDLI